MKKIILTSEQKEYVKQQLLSKHSLTQIAKELKISREVLSREARNIMGETFDFKRKTYINLSYFENIDTPEKAYWLGFLAADGYVVGNELNIQLQQSDKQHLKKFSDAINGNLTIRDINGKNNFGTAYSHYRVSIKSDKMIQDLDKYGIVNRKSLLLQKPPINSNFYGYWILGYMDGDGCISKNKKKIRISLTGTKEVISFIKDYLHSQNVISLEHRCQNTYRIQLENDLSLAFLQRMDYGDLPFCLERKKEIFNYYNSSLTQ